MMLPAIQELLGVLVAVLLVGLFSIWGLRASLNAEREASTKLMRTIPIADSSRNEARGAANPASEGQAQLSVKKSDEQRKSDEQYYSLTSGRT